MATKNTQTSTKQQSIPPIIRTIVTIVLLLSLFFYPPVSIVGIFVMWFWTVWKRWIKISITILFVIVLFVTTTMYQPIKMYGDSMSPTYQDGEYLLTSVYKPQQTTLNRGDIIVFNPPIEQQERKFINRIIALPGEKVMIKNADVYINDKRLDENSYIVAGDFLQEGQSVTVPKKHYFVISDNRLYGSSSTQFGFVPQENIISIVQYCYWDCK